MGALVVIIGIVLIVMIHEAGHFVTAKRFGMKATEFFFGFGPKLWSTQRGETEYGVKALPLGGYVKIIGMNPMEEVPPEEEHRTYRGKPFWQKSIVVMAGVASHFVIAFVLLWVANVLVGEPVAGEPTLRIEAVTIELADGTPSAAAVAGIEPGDEVVAVNGSPVADWDEFSATLRSLPGEGVVITVQRDGEFVDLTTVLTANVNPETGEQIGFLGVSPTLPVVAKNRANPIEGIGVAAEGVVSLTADSFRGLWAFISNFTEFLNGVFTSEELADETRPVSIVGVAQLGNAGQEVGGFYFTLQLIAFFAIFTGILNAIPLYPFDGGHFAVALYEKIRGRHPDIRKLMPISAALFLLLVFLGVVTIFLDITNPIDLG